MTEASPNAHYAMFGKKSKNDNLKLEEAAIFWGCRLKATNGCLHLKTSSICSVFDAIHIEKCDNF